MRSLKTQSYLRIFVALFAVLAILGVALVFEISFGDADDATEPAEPRYLADGSNLFWFMQISDTHVSTFFNNWYDDNLRWAVGEAAEVISPWFIINTGDLTDSTDGVIYGTGPHEDEWLEYRGIIEESLDPNTYYFDIAGNHDAYGDGQLIYYRTYSILAPRVGTIQPHWLLRFSHGKYHFLAGADTANDGRQWWSDNSIYTQDELNEFEQNLQTVGIADFTMVFGHHDYTQVENHQQFVELLQQYGARYYSHGHEHDLAVHVGSDGIIRWRISSLGQTSKNNVAVWAVDNYTVSVSVFAATHPWPVIVTTAPGSIKFYSDKDKEWVDIPYVPSVPHTCTNAPIRVLVFDPEEVPVVRARIDGGAWFELSQRQSVPQQWRGRFDATALSIGVHDLEVEARSAQTNVHLTKFLVEERACDIGEEDPDEPLDPGEIEVFGASQPDGDIDAVEEPEYENEQEEVELPQICTPGELKCSENILLFICNDAGTGWELEENCVDEGLVCNNKACVPVDGDMDSELENTETEAQESEPECEEGTKSCNEDVLMICFNGEWRTYRDCAPLACVDGACVDKPQEQESNADSGASAADGGCSGSGSSRTAWALILAYLLVGSIRKRAHDGTEEKRISNR